MHNYLHYKNDNNKIFFVILPHQKTEKFSRISYKGSIIYLRWLKIRIMESYGPEKHVKEKINRMINIFLFLIAIVVGYIFIFAGNCYSNIYS